MSTEIGYEGGMFEFGPGNETGWETGPFEFSQEGDHESALIGELLEVASDEELDQFLGSLARSVIKGASNFVKSPIGQAVGGVLKSVAKRALPMVGGALGSMVLPGVGTALGSKLGSMAGNLLEADEVAMLGEAADEEAARRFIRFASATYRNAARTPRYVPPRAAARAASVAAARMYAPSLLRQPRVSGWRGRRRGYPTYDDSYDDTAWTDQSGDNYAGAGAGATTGRWIRQGNRVTLIGL